MLSFELFDAQLLPYSNETFDIVHVRGVHTGVRHFFLYFFFTSLLTQSIADTQLPTPAPGNRERPQTGRYRHPH